MTPDDPRHGQNRGYVAGCRDACCRQAHMVEMKRYRMTGAGLVSALGAHRRLQGLVAIGWPLAQLSRRLGHNRNYMRNILKVNEIQASTHAAVAAMYDELCMTIPADPPQATHPVHRRARDMAARNGWPTPLAWDDIDNDPAPLTGCAHAGCLNKVVTRGMCDTHNRAIPAHQRTAWHDDIDPVVVARILAGEYTLKATRAEKEAVVAAWPGSQYRLAELTGWKVERYTRQDGAA